mmetsp:Transcript_748/g.1243  ORF Transcript_748/g.1243 Transcript_748/m.1243 type:complete len:169 (+) Transcript_748:80-586(+)
MSNRIVKWTAADSEHIKKIPAYSSALDHLGELSGIDQKLNGPITSIDKFTDSDHVLLVCENESKEPLGYLKYGMKNLFFYKSNGQVVEMKDVICVLDFYVHESCQRQGIGRELFDSMLELLEVSPSGVAYDRPSHKLLAFLRKHYSLTSPDLQPNRYAIFPAEGFVIG